MKFTIHPELKQRGLKVAMARIDAAKIVNRKSGLEEKKKEIINSTDWQNVESSPILEGYTKLYSDHSLTPPALNLLKLIRKTKRFPNINTVVDSYNLIVAKALFSIGAHDISKIKGDIKFTILEGNERYTPLGSDSLVPVTAQEYAAVDDEKVICYLDQKQCDETKITKDTKEFIVYVQGNENTTQEEVDNILNEVIDTIKQFCGGNSSIIQEEVAMDMTMH